MKLPTKEAIAQNRRRRLVMAKRATLSEKALDVIDSMICENEVAEGDPFLGKIYEIAHGCNRLNACYSSHKNWRKSTIERFEKMVDRLRQMELFTNKEGNK